MNKLALIRGNAKNIYGHIMLFISKEQTKRPRQYIRGRNRWSAMTNRWGR